MIYADVIVNITAHALDRPFQYRIPEALRDKLEVGSVVTVPFGNGNRPVTGYVIGLSDQPALEPERIKELSEAVLDASDEEKRLTGLAVWIRDRYGSNAVLELNGGSCDIRPLWEAGILRGFQIDCDARASLLELGGRGALKGTQDTDYLVAQLEKQLAEYLSSLFRLERLLGAVNPAGT